MKCYLCIDLKTFYASVECVIRGLDPFKTNLVVADSSRGKGAICLAITPALKALGIRNRCRLFEIPTEITYLTAKPQMKLYMEYSAKIYQLYLDYIAPEDIHPYSIDEVFIDVTSYLALYNLTAEKLALKFLELIYKRFGLTATVGIGTNLFLAKVALDITAKHQKNNMAYLDEELFKKTLWFHEPLTDFWQIATGINQRLKKLGINNMFQLANYDWRILYQEFGINAEILIDHANGLEPVEMKHLKLYKPQTKSLSSSQILFSDYDYEGAKLVLKEMVDILVLDLVGNKQVTSKISLFVGYAKKNMRSTGGMKSLGMAINTYSSLLPAFLELYAKTTLKQEPIRQLGISFNQLEPESKAYFNLFVDQERVVKETNLTKTINELKEKYGKNIIIKGMDLLDGATTQERNLLIGGHKA